jgi:hypothetical protein
MNQVQLAYNDFGQLVTEWQAHGGAVNTSSTPSVQYAYDSERRKGATTQFRTGKSGPEKGTFIND